MCACLLSGLSKKRNSGVLHPIPRPGKSVLCVLKPRKKNGGEQLKRGELILNFQGRRGTHLELETWCLGWTDDDALNSWQEINDASLIHLPSGFERIVKCGNFK